MLFFDTYMSLDFATFMDLLAFLLPASIALIALFWPNLQALYRRRAVTRLILRELEELTPSPKEPEDGCFVGARLNGSVSHKQIGGLKL